MGLCCHNQPCCRVAARAHTARPLPPDFRGPSKNTEGYLWLEFFWSKISLHVPGHFGQNVKGRCPDQDIGSDLCLDDEAPQPTVSAACLPFVTLNPNT